MYKCSEFGIVLNLLEIVNRNKNEWKLNFKSDCSPIAKLSSKSITVTQEGTASADDLDIQAYGCVQYSNTSTSAYDY